MRIEIWSDFACPFCYIGKRMLEAALNNFNEKNSVELVYKSFQLNPEQAEKISGIDYHLLIAKKYGITPEEAKHSTNQITEMAKSVGIDFYLDNVIHCNTLNAHRLSKYSVQHGKSNEMIEALLKAYFVDCLDIEDIETLGNLAQQVGLDKNEVITVLSSDAFTNEVINERKESNYLKIRSVPFYIFDNKYSISGAKPPEVFLEALNGCL